MGETEKDPYEELREAVYRAVSAGALTSEAYDRYVKMEERIEILTEERDTAEENGAHWRERVESLGKELAGMKTELEKLREKAEEVDRRERTVEIQEAMVQAKDESIEWARSLLVAIVRAPIVRRIVDREVPFGSSPKDAFSAPMVATGHGKDEEVETVE